MNWRPFPLFRNSTTVLSEVPQPPTAAVVPVQAADVATPSTQRLQDAIGNVIHLPPRTSLDMPAGLDSPLSNSPAATPQPRGLLDAPELKAFFADNHFGLGRHNGANYTTQEALALGKQARVSKFQNAVAGIAQQKQARADRLCNTKLQTEGICCTTTEQLKLACTLLERDIAVLHDQINQAAEGKGWVLNALNEYQIGFAKGMREAIAFELLGNSNSTS